MCDIHPVLKIWLSPVRTPCCHRDRQVVNHWLGVVLLPMHDKEVVGMLQLHVVRSCRPSPSRCKIHPECIKLFQMVQGSMVSPSYPTPSQLLNSVWVQNLQVGIHRARVFVGNIIWMLPCSVVMIVGVCLQLWWCCRVTLTAVWYIKRGDLLLTCWKQIQIWGRLLQRGPEVELGWLHEEGSMVKILWLVVLWLDRQRMHGET